MFCDVKTMFHFNLPFCILAGSINDLAVMHTANKDYVAAEKSLKRALLMVERSYKVDTHLRSSLLGNLANVHRLTGNRESCLHYTEELLPLLSKTYTATKHAAVDISTLNPAESQESLDLFWKNLTQSSSNVAEETKTDNGGNIARDRFYNSRQLFSSIRKVQFFLSAGHSIGTSRLHEEGLIYLNKAFEVIVTNSIDSHGGDDLILKDSFVLSAALATLGELSEHSQKQRGKGLIAKHIEHDNVSKLFKLPYFTTNYPSICDLDLGLTSSSRDLKNAATQLYKSRISKQISHNNFNNELSEYDRMMFCNKGIVGIALLDIEHFCPPISASDPQTPDAESSISN